ncbi:MAG: hypothetical protein FJ202_13835 [Gemmatimonadetes bacterium]|nr:hypothetical protein [Gemmatimonadota bacterium]
MSPAKALTPMGSARALLGVAVVMLLAATVGALRVDAAAEPISAAAVPDSALRFPDAGERADLAGAVARDLFSEDRRAPLRRYRMPDEPTFGVGTEPLAPPVLLGTAIAADGSHFAVVRGSVPGSTQIVRVGGQVGSHTVLSIERGRVTFRAPLGDTLTLNAIRP